MGVCRFWSVSVASVALLTGCNVLLTVRLLQSSTECGVDAPLPPPHPPSCAPPSLQKAAHAALISASAVISPNSSEWRMDVRLGRWDNRRLYRMFDWTTIGEKYAEK
jgi:beta-1,4-glucuronyltransferase 1